MKVGVVFLLRKKLHLTQQEFATLLGYKSRANVYYLERRMIKPNPNVLKKLMEIAIKNNLGVTYQEIIEDYVDKE